jgi:DnaJ like chaperone protein
MIIYGKVIGAILGYIFIGPPGFILGLVFGQIFDRGLGNLLNKHGHTANVRMVFFKTVFQTMGYLAKSDGVVSVREVEVAREIMQHDFNLDKHQMLLAINYFNEGKKHGFNLSGALYDFRTICGRYGDLRRFFLELLVKSSMADRTLHSAQKEQLTYICNSLGIPISELNYLLRSYGYSEYTNRSYNYNNSHAYSGKQTRQEYNDVDNKLNEAYNILGVHPSDNIKTIKNAYRRLMSKYHPDKLVAKGLPPEMMDVAKQKTQQVIAAYNLIMRERK